MKGEIDLYLQKLKLKTAQELLVCSLAGIFLGYVFLKVVSLLSFLFNFLVTVGLMASLGFCCTLAFPVVGTVVCATCGGILGYLFSSFLSKSFAFLFGFLVGFVLTSTRTENIFK